MNSLRATNGLRPLVYLFTRSFLNGVWRSLSSPKRAIGLIFFGAYYYFFFIRSVIPAGTRYPLPAVANRFEMPDPAIISGIAFALFALASVFLMPGILTFRGGFRPADVDVLFPTPVSPRVVLIFRIVRDYLFTLVAPLLLGLMGWRATSIGLTNLIHDYPVHSMDMLRSVWLAWMLMSLGWISLNYGASLFVGRSDLRSDRNQKIIHYTVNGLLLLALVYIGFSLREDLSWRSGMQLTHSVLLQMIFLPATIATDLVMGSLQGNFFLIFVALAGLFSIIGLGFALALTQVGWLYDQAAAKGFGEGSIRMSRRAGRRYALAAEKAREGKLGRMMISKWLARLSTTGPLGLVWKEQLLLLRGPMSGAVFTLIAILCVYGGTAYLLLRNSLNGAFAGAVFILPCFTAYFLACINGFSGFFEMLKKVDLLKPLPFTPGRIIFYEVAGKVPICGILLLAGTVELCAISPSLILSACAGLIMGLALLLVIMSAILLTVVIFPDFEDPTQRGLAAMIMLVSMVICSSPGLALYLVLSQFLKLAEIVAVIPSAAVLVAISCGAAYISGQIYASYNPTE